MPAKLAAASATAAAGRWMRGAGTGVRAFRPTPLITLTLALILGGAGGAGAATGGNFILGKSNSETTTATLANSKGTPLTLSAPAGKAPLAVNRKALVSNLNAEYLNGFTYDQLAVQGGDGFSLPSTDLPVSQTAEPVASTGHLTPGTYYVTATALAAVATGDFGLTCWLSKGSNPGANNLSEGGESQEGPRVQAAETVAVAVSAGDTIQEWCRTDGFHGSFVYNAGITAIRVLFFTGTPPARPGVPVKHAPPSQRRGTSASPSGR